METEDSFGRMVVSMRAVGTRENNMESGITQTIMESSGKDNGLRESASNG